MNHNNWVAEAINNIASFSDNTTGGIDRQAFSKADNKARDYVIGLMKETGLEVRIDPIGNIIGRLEGTDKMAPAVITGSHLDTVPNGGKYDGVVGVIGGLAAIKKLKDKKTKHPLELIVFVAEESSRFAFATMGSKAMIGKANIQAWKKAVDNSGMALPDVLKSYGLDIDSISAVARKSDDIKAFVELHIEQGPILEKKGKTIGVVEMIAAPTRLKIKVEGIAGHSGTTPMTERRDALVAASMVVLAVQDIALEQFNHGTVATVGALKVHPGAINVIPGLVEMWVDIRGINHASIIECLQDIKDAVSTIADGQDLAISIEMLSSEKPVVMDKQIVHIIEDVCRKSNVSYQLMNSGAGHDAMNMAQLTATGMIFIPSHNGISHSPDEYTDIDDIMTGIDILTGTLYELAK